MKTIEKSTKESLAIVSRLYGQEVRLQWIDGTSATYTIDSSILEEIECRNSPDYIKVKSFRFTSLRSMDELTEEEKDEYQCLGGWFPYRNDFGHVREFYHDTAESIYYLESIGIDTLQIKDVEILIKD